MIFNQISEVYSFFKTLLESNFITALVGAGAGAIGAQFLAQKITTRELLIKEIRNVNSAISTTTHICFSFLAIKANATRVMHEKFFKDRQNFVEFLNHGQEIRDFDYFRDCGLILEPQVNIENLQKLIFNNLSLDQKAVSAFVFLEESIKLFSTSLSGRNKITEMHLLNYKN